MKTRPPLPFIIIAKMPDRIEPPRRFDWRPMLDALAAGQVVRVAVSDVSANFRSAVLKAAIREGFKVAIRYSPDFWYIRVEPDV